MDASGGDYPVLEVADPQRRESLLRENVPDPLAGEQTWPTAEVRSAALQFHCRLVTLCLAAQVLDERRQPRLTFERLAVSWRPQTVWDAATDLTMWRLAGTGRGGACPAATGRGAAAAQGHLRIPGGVDPGRCGRRQQRRRSGCRGAGGSRGRLPLLFCNVRASSNPRPCRATGAVAVATWRRVHMLHATSGHPRLPVCNAEQAPDSHSQPPSARDMIRCGRRWGRRRHAPAARLRPPTRWRPWTPTRPSWTPTAPPPKPTASWWASGSINTWHDGRTVWRGTLRGTTRRVHPCGGLCHDGPHGAYALQHALYVMHNFDCLACPRTRTTASWGLMHTSSRRRRALLSRTRSTSQTRSALRAPLQLLHWDEHCKLLHTEDGNMLQLQVSTCGPSDATSRCQLSNNSFTGRWRR
jgi:hypothetical protein